MVVKDRILKFINSFDQVIEHFPDLLSPQFRLVYSEFKKKCEIFQKQLGKNDSKWPSENDSPESIRANSAYIANHFPYQIANPIYRSLCDTQLSLVDIKNYICSGSQKIELPVLFQVDQSLDDLYVMVPNCQRALDGIFHNFTIGVDRDLEYCNEPHILITVMENDESDKNRVIFRISSNLQPTEKVRISTGPAAREIGGQAYKLFEIKLDYCAVEEEIDGILYNIHISLSFFKGVKIK